MPQSAARPSAAPRHSLGTFVSPRYVDETDATAQSQSWRSAYRMIEFALESVSLSGLKEHQVLMQRGPRIFLRWFFFQCHSLSFQTHWHSHNHSQQCAHSTFYLLIANRPNSAEGGKLAHSDSFLGPPHYVRRWRRSAAIGPTRTRASTASRGHCRIWPRLSRFSFFRSGGRTTDGRIKR